MISALMAADSQSLIGDIEGTQQAGGLGFPSISWSGKVPGVNGKGAFVITADQIEGNEDKTLLSDWDFGKVFIGGAMKEAYYTHDMVCVPVAWRTCWIKLSPERRVEARWGKFTKRTPEMAGSKTNTQVVVYLPSLKGYALLGLTGVSKTVAWDNDQKNKRYAQYPLGIQQLLSEVAKKASEALSDSKGGTVKVAPNMTFMVTLTNFLDDKGEPKIFSVGEDATSNMFAPTVYANPEKWEELYVGDGMYLKFVEDYIATFKSWTEEWVPVGLIGDTAKKAEAQQAFDDHDNPF